MKKKIIINIEKVDDGYVLEQDGYYEKIDGCLCGNSEIVKVWKTIDGVINYARYYADVINLPYGDIITIKRK